MKRIGQEDDYGCGIAVVAMIAGVSYRQAKRELRQGMCNSRRPLRRGYFKTEGLTLIAIDEALGARGFYLRRLYVAWFCDQVPDGEKWRYETREGCVWPPPPFAPVHFAQVIQPSGNSHFVVMLEDGTVLDPLREGEYRLEDWPQVSNVTGLVRA